MANDNNSGKKRPRSEDDNNNGATQRKRIKLEDNADNSNATSQAQSSTSFQKLDLLKKDDPDTIRQYFEKVSDWLSVMNNQQLTEKIKLAKLNSLYDEIAALIDFLKSILNEKEEKVEELIYTDNGKKTIEIEKLILEDMNVFLKIINQKENWNNFITLLSLRPNKKLFSDTNFEAGAFKNKLYKKIHEVFFREKYYYYPEDNAEDYVELHRSSSLLSFIMLSHLKNASDPDKKSIELKLKTLIEVAPDALYINCAQNKQIIDTKIYNEPFQGINLKIDSLLNALIDANRLPKNLHLRLTDNFYFEHLELLKIFLSGRLREPSKLEEDENLTRCFPEILRLDLDRSLISGLHSDLLVPQDQQKVFINTIGESLQKMPQIKHFWLSLKKIIVESDDHYTELLNFKNYPDTYTLKLADCCCFKSEGSSADKFLEKVAKLIAADEPKNIIFDLSQDNGLEVTHFNKMAELMLCKPNVVFNIDTPDKIRCEDDYEDEDFDGFALFDTMNATNKNLLAFVKALKDNQFEVDENEYVKLTSELKQQILELSETYEDVVCRVIQWFDSRQVQPMIYSGDIKLLEFIKSLCAELAVKDNLTDKFSNDKHSYGNILLDVLQANNSQVENLAKNTEVNHDVLRLKVEAIFSDEQENNDKSLYSIKESVKKLLASPAVIKRLIAYKPVAKKIEILAYDILIELHQNKSLDAEIAQELQDLRFSLRKILLEQQVINNNIDLDKDWLANNEAKIKNVYSCIQTIEKYNCELTFGATPVSKEQVSTRVTSNVSLNDNLFGFHSTNSCSLVGCSNGTQGLSTPNYGKK